METKVADLPKPQEKIFKDFHAETKADEGAGKRILVAKISTPNTDRSKDHVLAKGAIIDNFMKNPVVQFAHKYDELPIAKCTALKGIIYEEAGQDWDECRRAATYILPVIKAERQEAERKAGLAAILHVESIMKL